MNEHKSVIEINGCGTGFFGLLTILFIALKLCGVIDWAWVWVLAPLIFVAGLTIFSLIVALVVWIAMTR